MSSKLSERAMLASLTISRWQATLTDKKVTSEVATQHSVESKRAGRYRKYAINVNEKTFKAVCAASSDLRHRHYFWTLPWGQEGARILTAVNFEKYSAEMRRYRATFESAADDFAAEYPALIEAAKAELRGLFNPTDYPRNIRKKFGVDFSIMPLPDSDDFRAQLTEGAVAEIKAGIEQELARTTAQAMREPYERLYSHISRMVERLTDPEGKFRDSLVDGLVELCGVLPGLNLTADPLLEELRVRAESLIAGVDAQTLRDKPSVRADVAKRATEIQDLMSSYMGEAPASVAADVEEAA